VPTRAAGLATNLSTDVAATPQLNFFVSSASSVKKPWQSRRWRQIYGLTTVLALKRQKTHLQDATGRHKSTALALITVLRDIFQFDVEFPRQPKCLNFVLPSANCYVSK